MLHLSVFLTLIFYSLLSYCFALHHSQFSRTHNIYEIRQLIEQKCCSISFKCISRTKHALIKVAFPAVKQKSFSLLRFSEIWIAFLWQTMLVGCVRVQFTFLENPVFYISYHSNKSCYFAIHILILCRYRRM